MRSIEWNSDSVRTFIRGDMVPVLSCPVYVPRCAPLNTEFFSLAKLSLPLFSFLFFFFYGSLLLFEKGSIREQNTLASFTLSFITGMVF